MPDLIAKRTLVKSPPELWEELSDLEGLDKHLGEFGEIRITKVEPETTVAWEGEHASGTVEIEASGWGTKVVLTASVPEPEPPEPVAAEPQPVAEPEPIAVEPGPEPERAPVAEPDLKPEPEAEPEPEPEPVAVKPEPAPVAVEPRPTGQPYPMRPAQPEPERRGFFARLFGRKVKDSRGSGHHNAPNDEPGARFGPAKPAPVATAPEPQPELAPTQPPSGSIGRDDRLSYPGRSALATPAKPESAVEPPSAAQPEPTPPEPEAFPVPKPPEPQPEPESAARPEPEPVAAGIEPERAQAVLDAALDNLGQAHHRPFSRG